MKSDRPRALQFFNSFAPGGMERQTTQLVRALCASGEYEVHVAAHSAKGALLCELLEIGVSSISEYPLRNMYGASTCRQALRLAQWLYRMRVSVVHTHDFYTNVFGMAAAMLARVPVRIASRRELDVFSAPQRAVEHIAYRTATVVAANCVFLRQQLIREGVPQHRSTVLRNAVDPVRLTPGSHDTLHSLRARLGIPPGSRVVAMIANNYNVKKDTLTYVRAAVRLAERNPHVRFMLVGGGTLSETASAELSASTLKDRFILNGFSDQIGDLLAISHIGVLCSHSEGLPNAVLEYMAAGLPVVATDVGGTGELVEHSRTGFLVSQGDEVAVADAIQHLLDNSAIARDFGSCGRRTVAAEYSLAAQSEAVLHLYGSHMAPRLSV